MAIGNPVAKVTAAFRHLKNSEQASYILAKTFGDPFCNCNSENIGASTSNDLFGVVQDVLVLEPSSLNLPWSHLMQDSAPEVALSLFATCVGVHVFALHVCKPRAAVEEIVYPALHAEQSSVESVSHNESGLGASLGSTPLFSLGG